MKTENEIKAIIEKIANECYRTYHKDWEIKEWCIDMTTYKEDKEYNDECWWVKFALIETLPNMSTLEQINTIISNAGGKQAFLSAGDNWNLFIHFMIR